MREIKQEAFGEMGLHPWEFYKYDMEEYVIKREGLHKSIKEAREETWEQTRWLAFQVLSPHLKKGSKIDQVFPKADGKKLLTTGKELREQVLKAARESRNNGRQRTENKDRGGLRRSSKGS